mgnify:CR=1 FL=1
MIGIKNIIPEGMRDFTIDECKRRNNIISTIKNCFENWGYNEISTPTVEYYETFNHKIQSLKEEEMYKFFDNRGRILTLRPDMTVPVARLVNSKLKDMELPLKLFYSANVFRVHDIFEGKRNEYLDCGIELIGAYGREIDLEVLVTALEVLKALDTKKEFKLEIGNVNILKSALNNMNLYNYQKDKLIELINKKSLTSLKNYLNCLDIKNEYKYFLNDFPWLFGGYEMINKAKKIAFNKEMKENIKCLEQLYLDLSKLGYEKYISVDMSMVPRVNYYSGIIFKGYVNEIGSTVLRGGRYDNLLDEFSKSMPAIGFSVDTNLLLDSCDYKEKSNVEKIHLNKEDYLNVLKEAVAGKRVIMIDDSIVRGTTSHQIVRMLRDAGAKEVHVKVSAPPFLHPCYFGTDIPSEEQLIAHNRTIDQICELIGADSLSYLRMERFYEMAEGLPICTACFNGEYPIDPPKEDIRGEYTR